jgi:hypothetical protein
MMNVSYSLPKPILKYKLGVINITFQSSILIVHHKIYWVSVMFINEQVFNSFLKSGIKSFSF